MKLERIVAICLGAVILGMVGSASADRPSREASNLPPLSHYLPSSEFAKLRGGKIARGRWAFFLYRAKGGVCLVGLLAQEAVAGKVSVTSGSPSCRSSSKPPTLVSGMGLGRDVGRALSFVFFRRIADVEVLREDGSVARKTTRSLSPRQRRVLGVRRVAFVIARDRVPHCFTHLRAISARGRLIEGFPLAPCGS